MDEAKAAKRLANDLVSYHAEDMKNPAKRDAVIVKCVALVALAFDLPPTTDESYDVDEMVDKLRTALAELGHKQIRLAND